MDYSAILCSWGGTQLSFRSMSHEMVVRLVKRDLFPKGKWRRADAVAFYLALLGFLVTLLAVGIKSSYFQHDLRSYYFAAKVYFQESPGNPYDLNTLVAAAAEEGAEGVTIYPFLYPIHSLNLFRPLIWCSFPVAYYVYLILKIAY